MPGEKITAVIPIRNITMMSYLLMATKKGLVKKTPIKEYAECQKDRTSAIILREEDELIEVKVTDRS